MQTHCNITDDIRYAALCMPVTVPYRPSKKLTEFTASKPVSYKMLKGLLYEEGMKKMKNKMTINTYLSTIESKNQKKGAGGAETDSWMPRMFPQLPDRRGWGAGRDEETGGVRKPRFTAAETQCFLLLPASSLLTGFDCFLNIDSILFLKLSRKDIVPL